MKLWWMGIFVIACLVVACDHKTYICDIERQVAASGWAWADTLTFPFEIRDTQKVYNIWLNVGHKDNFAAQNLYCQLQTKYPNGEVKKQVISFELSDGKGHWRSDCSGEDCKIELGLQERAFFNQTGKYELTLEQFGRQDSLKGVSSFELRLEDAGIRKK
jgi:gliding motility-associated lipoprotein GldH